VFAPGRDLAACDLPAGAVGVPLERALRTRATGLFVVPRRRIRPGIRIAALAACVAALCILVAAKSAARLEARAEGLRSTVQSLESARAAAAALEAEAAVLTAERDRLSALMPEDPWLLLSELQAALGNGAKVHAVSFHSGAFQVSASSADPLLLMEHCRNRGCFAELKLGPVVPDPASGRERFSFSGVFRGK
jgi:cell division protein FtsB